jgi:hypothetical protein
MFRTLLIGSRIHPIFCSPSRLGLFFEEFFKDLAVMYMGRGGGGFEMSLVFKSAFTWFFQPYWAWLFFFVQQAALPPYGSFLHDFSTSC